MDSIFKEAWLTAIANGSIDSIHYSEVRDFVGDVICAQCYEKTIIVAYDNSFDYEGPQGNCIHKVWSAGTKCCEADFYVYGKLKEEYVEYVAESLDDNGVKMTPEIEAEAIDWFEREVAN